VSRSAPDRRWHHAARAGAVTAASDAAGEAAAPPGRLVEARGLHCAYAGGRAVLHDIDLTVDAGEFLAIVGRSGCGKTTLLRALAGLGPARRTAGTLQVHTDRLDMVFQQPALLPWRSAVDNVEYGALVEQLPRPHRPAALEALTKVGLAEAADKLPHQLSGGMRARVALARALMLNPALLLLDEPFAAVDVITKAELGTLLERLWLEARVVAENRFAAVLVTHDVEEAVRRATRVVVMSSTGRVAAEVRVDLPYPRHTVETFDPACGRLVADLYQRLKEAEPQP
jgi:ABC-type nitrate/sulfonate/bicarbonate transport system ATPase subunit